MNLVEERREIYRHYVATGRPPAPSAEALRALEAAHAVVLNPDGTIAFANPFATPPAPFRVRTPAATHYAICACDALGILAALSSDGTVETSCPDRDKTIVVRVREGAADPADAVVHFLVPAARWYEDLAFT